MADERAILLDVDTDVVGTVAVVRARGEIDLVTAPLLADAIAGALAQSPTAVVVDMSHVGFLASVGMSVLITARRSAADDVALVVVADGPHTRRPMELVGLDSMVPVHTDLASAITAVTSLAEDENDIAEPA